MKVLIFVSGLYGGGAERIATYLANYLNETSSVSIATFHGGGKTYQIDKNINIEYINPKFSPFPLNILRPLTRYINIWKTIKKIDPDVIISFSVSLNYWVLLVNKLTKKKIIVSERTSLSRFISKKAEYARSTLYKEADKVVLLSQEDYNKASHLKNKVIIYNPLHFQKYTSDTPREKTIVAIGSTARWNVKGFDLLIEAWSKIANDNPDWTLEIIGKNNHPYINQLIDKYNLNNRVRFIGHTDKLEEELRKKSIYVLSSRYEGFPNSLTEAMSQGCACIAFNCSTGPKEIITDGVSGLLAKEMDINDLANKINLLIHDKQLREKLSTGAITEVDRFNSDLIMSEWKKVITKVVCE